MAQDETVRKFRTKLADKSRATQEQLKDEATKNKVTMLSGGGLN